MVMMMMMLMMLMHPKLASEAMKLFVRVDLLRLEKVCQREASDVDAEERGHEGNLAHRIDGWRAC